MPIVTVLDGYRGVALASADWSAVSRTHTIGMTAAARPPLRSLPNTLLLPHVGDVTSDQYRAFYRDAVENILAFAAGAPVRVLT